MATVLYLRSEQAGRGSTSWLGSSAVLGDFKKLSLVRGTASVSVTDQTLNSLSTSIANGSVVEAVGASNASSLIANAATPETLVGGTRIWISEPLYAFTPSTAPAPNLRAAESAAQANYGIGGVIYQIAAGGGAASAWWNFYKTTELGTTDAAITTFTTASRSTPTFNDGDMIGVVLFWISAGGTSASGRTATFTHSGPTAAAAGDSFITFVETIREWPQPRGAAVDSALGVFCKAHQAARRFRFGRSGILLPDGVAWGA